MRDFNNGALDMEALANVRICQDMLGYHLCFATRDRHFHEAFVISSKSTFILWTLLNVPNEVPEGGKTSTFVMAFASSQDLQYTT
jgi:hypothetical protein